MSINWLSFAHRAGGSGCVPRVFSHGGPILQQERRLVGFTPRTGGRKECLDLVVTEDLPVFRGRGLPGRSRLGAAGGVIAIGALLLALAGCAPQLTKGEFEPQYSQPPASGVPIWQAVDRAAAGKAPDWFVPVNTGPEALRWRLALIDSATEHLDAKYFIWSHDHTGSLMLGRILEAADRGVQVRLLVDDVLLSSSTDEWIAAKAHPNIRIRIFNPFAKRAEGPIGRFIENLNDFARVNHRMHNKALIVDGQIAIMGGRNVADEYHGFGDDANFRDFDVLAGGEVIGKIAAAYDRFWNSGWAYPADQVQDDPMTENAHVQLRVKLAELDSPLSPWLEKHSEERHDWTRELVMAVEGAFAGEAVVLADSPDAQDVEGEHLVSRQLVAAAERAQDELLLLTPYLIPSDHVMGTFETLDARDVDVRILTNSINTNNHTSAHAAYAHHREAILDAGADLHEFRVDAVDRERYEAQGYRAERFTMHAKLVIIDRRHVFVGTFNTDPRSMFINTEIGLLIDSPDLAGRIHELVQHDFAPRNAWRVERADDGRLRWTDGDQTLDREPAASGWLRFKIWALGLFPMEHQL
jgi:putative cardiolipin synthase